jgi:hypothetical protein
METSIVEKENSRIEFVRLGKKEILKPRYQTWSAGEKGLYYNPLFTEEEQKMYNDMPKQWITVGCRMMESILTADQYIEIATKLVESGELDSIS